MRKSFRYFQGFLMLLCALASLKLGDLAEDRFQLTMALLAFVAFCMGAAIYFWLGQRDN